MTILNVLFNHMHIIVWEFRASLGNGDNKLWCGLPKTDWDIHCQIEAKWNGMLCLKWFHTSSTDTYFMYFSYF